MMSNSLAQAAEPGTRVIVGMSGGVDSSVAAAMLLEQGYSVEGLFMKNWDEDDGTEYCTAKEDLADAQQVAERLGITLHTANFAAEYWDGVFEHFLSEYQAARTPNPDILCNKEIKFRAFLDYAVHLGADYIATGHYARKRNVGASAQLLKGLDEQKDQSYFLHAVAGEQLAKSLFPLGEIKKTEVREIARRHGFITHDKKDSTGICFIGERKFSDFLENYLAAQPGDIISSDGEKLGAHNGLMFHTIGQRQGLGIGGVRGNSEGAWYVAGKDLEANQLVVVQGNDHPALFGSALIFEQMHWIQEVSELPLRCNAKIRYRQDDQACTVVLRDGALCAEFDSPQRAISPGQSIVLYQNDVCLGGGIIVRSL